jgi:peptide-methionine (R)-S-oxide reductase
MPKVEKSEKEWRDQLTPEQYQVTREAGTERAFTGPYVDEKAEGMYRCVCCGTELFSSDTKFDSGTGWPSFTEPQVAESVELREDRSWGMNRTEVVCRNCGGHLGHVFDDGPRDAGGMRYCINGCALRLEKG